MSCRWEASGSVSERRKGQIILDLVPNGRKKRKDVMWISVGTILASRARQHPRPPAPPHPAPPGGLRVGGPTKDFHSVENFHNRLSGRCWAPSRLGLFRYFAGPVELRCSREHVSIRCRRNEYCHLGSRILPNSSTQSPHVRPLEGRPPCRMRHENCGEIYQELRLGTVERKEAVRPVGRVVCDQRGSAAPELIDMCL